MQNKTGRQTATLALVFGAVVFGMVLAGGAQLTPVTSAQSSGFDNPVEAPAAVGSGALPSFADLAEAVSPAVVSIRATTIERGPQRRGGLDPFEFFFGPRQRDPRVPPGQRPQQPEERRSDSAGSGFVISSDGLVVTNHHVIEGASNLVVELNGREYPAEVKGDDPATDLALLKIEPEGKLQHLALGDSDDLRVGDWIMVIGSPLRLENSVSVGVVSAKGRSINITPDASLENFIQTDAAINFGNSGGPIVNLRGAVVGIATAINYGAENIGFAVPVETLKRILPQLRDRGTVRRGYLGVEISDLDYDLAESFGLESTDGTLINLVREGSPAEKAGLQHGDIVLEVDGRKVRNNRELIDYISAQPPDTKVELEIYRNGERMEKVVELAERPGTEEAIVPAAEEEESSIEWLGIQYRDLDAELREARGIPESVAGIVVTTVAPSSPLYGENVAPGDVISEVNAQAVTGVGEFNAAVEAAPSGSVLRFYVRRFTPQGQSASAFAVVRKP